MPLTARTVTQLVAGLLDQQPPAPQAPLFSSGLLDSFHLVELVEALEAEFAIRIRPSDFSMRNFDSIDSIVAFLNRKRAGDE